MKITPKQYAIALYQSTQYIPEKEASRIVKNFVDVLRKNNDLSLGEKIVEEYQNCVRQEKNISKIQITTSKEIDSGIINALTRKLEQPIEIEQKVDSGLIGGAVIRIGDVLIDGSVKNKLERLRKRIG